MGQGKAAKTSGKKIKNGEALPVTLYPRKVAKALIVKAAREANVSLSRFALLTLLQAIVGKSNLRKVLPVDEYDTLVLNKYGPTPKK
jgi:hypothetical protein